MLFVKVSIFPKLERFEAKLLSPFFSLPFSSKQTRVFSLPFLFPSFTFPFLSFLFSPKLLSKHSVRDNECSKFRSSNEANAFEEWVPKFLDSE